MKNKWIYWSVILLLLPSFSYAKAGGWQTQFDVGSSFLTSSTLSKMYGRALPTFRFEISHLLIENQGLSAFLSSEYTFADGLTLGYVQPTTIKLFPIGAGLKYQKALGSSLAFFSGAGPRYAYLMIHNDSEFLLSEIRRNGYGGEGFLGFSLKVNEKFMLSSQAGYSVSYFSNKGLDPSADTHDMLFSAFNIVSGMNMCF